MALETLPKWWDKCCMECANFMQDRKTQYLGKCFLAKSFSLRLTIDNACEKFEQKKGEKK